MNLFKAKHSQWHVIYVRPKFEKKVHVALIEKNMQVYLPLKKEVRQWHDRKKKIEVPTFPGYMFVYIARTEMPNLYSIPGFVKFITTAGIPDVISEKRMDMIKKVLNGQYELSGVSFSTGEKVRVLRGAFKDLEGVLTGHKSSCRLAVKIEVVNQYVIINAKAEDLERVNHTKKVA